MRWKLFFITSGISRCQIKMRALLKILQSDSCALWIIFCSLMYEAENVKNIVKYHLDMMMECHRKHYNSGGM